MNANTMTLERTKPGVHAMPFGAEPQSEAGVRFRIWAPAQNQITLVDEDTGNKRSMTAEPGGWHEVIATDMGPGSRYRFELASGIRVPDPASRYQPEDVHGPSAVIDASEFRWTDTHWRGRSWHEAVIYELHVGTFTQEGTFRAAMEHLSHLAALGVTALEIMPVADFPGRWNWGYDGVLPYAPDSTYGHPDDMRAFVDAAHRHGIMVLLDVVYNHFGPDGNYLKSYAPDFFTDRHKTPWGDAVNYDGPSSGPVREFVIQNALYWLEEFHLDGLRLDAVHQIKDDSPVHILTELADRVRAATPDRHIHLVLENEENESSRLSTYTAQWNDDLHHVLHTAATGEDAGYYAEYRGDTDKLARALAEGFAFQGHMMEYRGTPRGEPSAHLPPTSFIAFIQNHDQIGNRAFGERISRLAGTDVIRAISAVYLLLPQVPMLFMGEEWNTHKPFPFFCDFPGELGEKVRNGRREEFARFPEFQDPAKRQQIPDPQSEATFRSAKLDWEFLGKHEHAEWLAFYRQLLSIREAVIVPFVAAVEGHAGSYRVLGSGAVVVCWRAPDGRVLTLAANLSGDRIGGFPSPTGDVCWQEGECGADGVFGPWSVRWWI